MIGKGQARWVSGHDVCQQNRFMTDCSICLPKTLPPSSSRGGFRHAFKVATLSSGFPAEWSDPHTDRPPLLPYLDSRAPLHCCTNPVVLLGLAGEQLRILE
jgi:hypothetical protein